MVYFGILWYIVVYKGTAYLDDGLWVWQYQSKHSGGSSKQYRNMSTLELMYADVRQHRAHASQDQLESIVRKVCVQRDLQQSQYISLIMPVNVFENNVKWFKLPPRQKRLAQRWSLPVSAVFTNVCLTLHLETTMLFYTLLKVIVFPVKTSYIYLYIVSKCQLSILPYSRKLLRGF